MGESASAERATGTNDQEHFKKMIEEKCHLTQQTCNLDGTGLKFLSTSWRWSNTVWGGRGIADHFFLHQVFNFSPTDTILISANTNVSKTVLLYVVCLWFLLSDFAPLGRNFAHHGFTFRGIFQVLTLANGEGFLYSTSCLIAEAIQLKGA